MVSVRRRRDAMRCDRWKPYPFFVYLLVPCFALLCSLTRLLVLVASSATSGALQHAFLSLISQLTFSLLVARRVRVRDVRLLAVWLAPQTTDDSTTRHPQGLLWHISSNLFHSFDRPFVLEQEHALSSIAEAPYTILSHLSDARLLPKRSVHRRAPYCTGRQPLGMT